MIWKLVILEGCVFFIYYIGLMKLIYVTGNTMSLLAKRSTLGLEL